MRLWHYKLIPYLPNSQLTAQWRELNSIYKNQPNHILINYVYKHEKRYLLEYSYLVMDELLKRGIKIKSLVNWYAYFDIPVDISFNLHYPEHNNKYLVQCFYNLQEKYDRGQKDFSEECYLKLEQFIKSKLNCAVIF